MTKHRSLLAALAAAGVLFCGARGWTEPEPAQLAGADREFVLAAGMGSVGQVKVGQLAIERAVSNEVKRFATRMVEEHGKSSTELTSLAREKDAPAPPDAGAEQKVALARLAALSGAAFDRAYMAQMVADHRREIAAFRSHLRTSKDPVVKAWISKKLPALRMHLRTAREIAARVGAPAPEGK